jgi:predicted tellurium resistance membrane protein TerC
LDWILESPIWVALITLATLEIVLGVDNLVFISISVSRLPPEQRSRARRFGLALACLTRILLLVTLVELSRMQTTLFVLGGNALSIRDLVLIAGGIFLLVKGSTEIRDEIGGRREEEDISAHPSAVFGMVIAQIAIIDIVFSLDSVITAVGMVGGEFPANIGIPVMAAAIIVAVLVMMFAADPVGDFIDRHPTVKMLALGFIVMVGVALILDGLDVHVDRKYLYFAMAFSVGVEVLNVLAHDRAERRAQLRASRAERDQ